MILCQYFLAAASDTNITVFVHSNIVQYPPASPGGGGSGNISPFVPDGMGGASSEPVSTTPDMLMVMPAGGSSSAAPLMIYPSGFDLSGFTIFDPATGESVSGNGYSISAPSMDTMQAGGVWPMDAGSGDTNQYTGFYQVARDGVHIYGMTNGMVLSGDMQFSIELALDSTDEVVGVTFYDENNSPIVGASAQGAGNRWILDWNTPMVANGDYNIYAELDYASDAPAVSVPVVVTVSNVISFPNYASQIFGSQMWIYAQTIPNAAYQIDMYDENTNYLGAFTGSADSSGLISFIWDLGGLTSTNFSGVFTVDTSSLSGMSSGMSVKSLNASSPSFQTASVAKKTLGSTVRANGVRANGATPNAGSSSASANQLWAKEPAWTPNNNWVIAYASLTGDVIVDENAKDMILGGRGEDTDWGGVIGTLDEYGLNGNLSPGNNGHAGTVFTLNDTNSRSQLLSYLADHRYENFYFFGHGNNSVISAYNSAVTALTRDQIAYALDNVPLSYPIRHDAEHPYRFVFIDACNTGKGNFCEAFGIPAITVSTNFFASADVESRAFVGFTKPTGFDPSLSSGDPNGVPNRSIAAAYFMQEWLSGQYDLQTIIQNAENAFGYPIYKMSSSAVIYGAYDLMRFTRTRP